VSECRIPVLVGPRQLEWRQRRLLAAPGSGRVRLRTLRTLISPGTELRLFHGEPMADDVWTAARDLERSTPEGRPAAAEPSLESMGYPVGVGYNNVAEVEAIGDGVHHLDVGQRVFSAARHLERFDADAGEIVPVPEGVSDAAAAHAYIATLGLHALRRVQWSPGEPVAVIGLGLVGLCAALVAAACGAELHLIEAIAARRRLASDLLPAARVADPAALPLRDGGGLGPDSLPVVIEAAGGRGPLELALHLLAPRGRLAVMALHPEPLGSLFADAFYRKEISILSSTNDPYAPAGPAASAFSMPANVAFVLGLAARGRLPLERVCTHERRAADIASAYSELSARSAPERISVLLDWRQGQVADHRKAHERTADDL
jgi:D-arabinose 1-dehydrogenase-like Zn-dependent alcohol dehydrogenase